MRAGLALCVLVLAGCGRSVDYGHRGCPRPPISMPPLKLQDINGHPRLWTTDTCIPVTYSRTLEALRPTIQASLDAWDHVDCGGLCFELPQPRNGKPQTDDDFRLHFEDAGPDGPGAWELLNDGETGRALHASLFVSDASVLGEILRQLGHVLGFEPTNLGRDSVLEDPRLPSPRTTIGDVDRQSVCAVYPACI